MICPECGGESERGACVECPAAELRYGRASVVLFPSPLAVVQLTQRARLALRSMVKVQKIKSGLASNGKEVTEEKIERVKGKLIAWSVLHPEPSC